jgi:hypothetical protein
VTNMDDEIKRRIIEEAAANVADKAELNRDTARRMMAQPVDPMVGWRADAEQFERACEAETRARRRREREGLAQAQFNANTFENAFVDALAKHLPSHLVPIVQEIADSVVACVDALREQQIEREAELRRMRDEVCGLKIELARLATTLAELRTDRALGAMPGASMRTVN